MVLWGLIAVLAIAVLAGAISSIFPLIPPSNTTKDNQPKFKTSLLKLGGTPSAGVYDPLNRYLYVTYGDGTTGGVYVINGTKLLANISMDSGPGPLLYDPSNHYVYTAGINGHNVFVILDTKVISSIPIVNHPRGFVYDPSDDLVYLGTQQTGGVEGLPASIAAINGTEIFGYVAADCSNDHCSMLYDPADGMLYVASSGSDTVSMINGTTVEYTLKVGPGPSSLLFNPHNGMIYVAIAGFGNKIAVISGTEVVNVTVGADPGGFIYDNSTGDVYVFNEGDTTVSVIRGASNIANVSLGFTPRFGVYDPSNGFVYVPDEDGYDVAIVSGTRVVANVVTGPSPDAIFFNPANNNVYVSNAGFVGICFGGCPFEPSNNVSIISGSRVLENVTVGWHPGGMLYEQRMGSVYVLTWSGVGLIAGPSSISDSTAADTTSDRA